MQKLELALCLALAAGCTAAPPAEPAPAAVELAVDRDASFLEDTAEFRVVLIGKGFVLQAHLPLDLVRDSKKPDGSVDLEVAPVRCELYLGEHLPTMRPSGGPPAPPPSAEELASLPKPIAVEGITIGLRQGGKGGNSIPRTGVRIRCSGFTAGGKDYAPIAERPYEVRGPMP